jgi:glutathionylspermidine synthase
MVNSGKIARQADQFNALQEALIKHFRQLHRFHRSQRLFFACCKESEEDFGTVEYMRSCAMEAGLKTSFCFVEDIGLNDDNQLTDLNNSPISWMFKLYPWEFMFTDEFSPALSNLKMKWLEPAWKSIISNKAILPLLWQMYEGHPNLLPAYFAEEKHKLDLSKGVVKKPLFSREGANIEITKAGRVLASSSGGYGEEGFVYQAFHALPNFDGHYPLIGSWMVNNEAVAMSIREDSSLITQDLSRFVPHIILG